MNRGILRGKQRHWHPASHRACSCSIAITVKHSGLDEDCLSGGERDPVLVVDHHPCHHHGHFSARIDGHWMAPRIALGAAGIREELDLDGKTTERLASQAPSVPRNNIPRPDDGMIDSQLSGSNARPRQNRRERRSASRPEGPAPHRRP